jgi:BirA family biotin operon repressor/biotin-[acetyl-CoA-carboxylase] ligase
MQLHSNAQLPRSQAFAGAHSARLVVLESCGSTNTELASRASTDAAGYPHLSTLVTGNQVSGRGRLGRVWVAPPGRSLSTSVVLRPVLTDGTPLGLAHYGWLPLIAGVAMTRSVAELLPEASVTLKWPNDVHVDGKKVSGLLAELLDGSAVVMGAGLNLALDAAELPTPTSTSLGLSGATLTDERLADAALARYLEELASLLAKFLAAGGDPEVSGIRHAVESLCSTLGQQVRVELPGPGKTDDAADLIGVATGIDETGRLLVETARDRIVVAVAAGDVTHLRYE